jgi:hypothetical protein
MLVFVVTVTPARLAMPVAINPVAILVSIAVMLRAVLVRAHLGAIRSRTWRNYAAW